MRQVSREEKNDGIIYYSTFMIYENKGKNWRRDMLFSINICNNYLRLLGNDTSRYLYYLRKVLTTSYIIFGLMTMTLPFAAYSENRANLEPLSIGSTKFERTSEVGFSHKFAIAISNYAPKDEVGFNAWCEYNCPPGGTVQKAAFDIVMNGYIAAHKESIYTGFFRIQCVPTPPEIILMCPIKYTDGSESGPQAVTFRP